MSGGADKVALNHRRIDPDGVVHRVDVFIRTDSAVAFACEESSRNRDRGEPTQLAVNCLGCLSAVYAVNTVDDVSDDSNW